MVLNLLKPITITLPGGVPMTFARVPAGSFRMGQRGGNPEEEPVHRVVIPEDFYLGIVPVTQAQYRAMARACPSKLGEIKGHRGPDPSRFQGDQRPVEQVNWYEARCVCEWLTESGHLPSGWVADLPSEAQWEYSCRWLPGGMPSGTLYSCGDHEEDLKRVAWYGANADGETHDVGQKEGIHPLGLHDLHGNVWEWCLDYYDPRRYRKCLDHRIQPPSNRKSALEFEAAPVWIVELQSRMARFADGLLEFEVGDRDLLNRFLRTVEQWVENGDSDWADDVKAVRDALRTGTWPEAARPVAASTARTAQAWIGNWGDRANPLRVLRGGSWDYPAGYCRSASRIGWRPDDQVGFFGFRVCLVPGPSQQHVPAGAERAAGGGARRDAEAKPEDGRGAEVASSASSREGSVKEPLLGSESSEPILDGARALSSVDGRSWWDADGATAFPQAPDSSVRRLVVGELGTGQGLVLDEALVGILRQVASHFPGLTHLHLWSVSNLVEIDGLPPGLECLDVRQCPGLRKIGGVGGALQTLDLGSCDALEALPRGPLHRLEYVWLNGCRALAHFAPIQPALARLKRLELHGCRFLDLDTTLCGNPDENVAGKVCAFFEAVGAQGTEPFAECKVVVLGDGGVGKTELIRALKGLPFDADQDATDGIRLWRWRGGAVDGRVPDFAPFPEAGVDRVELNVWDFGGQDLYHNTHRLFLESRAIFVVVWSEPERQEGKMLPRRAPFPEDPIRYPNYWLDQIFASNLHARVVLVRTGIDRDRPREPWESLLRPEYLSETIRRFDVSAKERTQGDLKGLREHLLERVREELRGAAAVQMPRGRVAVRRRLREMQPAWDEGGTGPASDSKRPILRRHEFVDLSGQAFRGLGLPEPGESEIEWQLRYFHDAGTLFCPPPSPADSVAPGARPVVVDQRWMIEGIYRLMVRGTSAHALLLQSRGIVATRTLDWAWDTIRDDTGQVRYSAEARWVMRRFMERVGLFVPCGGGRLVMPEFLLGREMLEETHSDDRLIAAACATGESRRYRMRHRALGEGFGCLLVKRIVERFGRVPLFKYGGFGEVRVGSEYTGGEKVRGIVLEWSRSDELVGGFQGDILLTIRGEADIDAEIRTLVQEMLKTLPGFPPELEFEQAWSAGNGPTSWGPIAVHEPSLPEMGCWPVVREGLVAISYAGNDPDPKKDPLDHEFWPRSLSERLQTLTDRGFDVLHYKWNEERKSLSMPLLMRDLIQADILICVVGRKYLESKYCMAELFEAAQQHQPDGTFVLPDSWLERVWPVILHDAEALVLKGEVEAIRAWSDAWTRRASEHWKEMSQLHGGRKPAAEEAPKQCFYHGWMTFAEEDQSNLRQILAALAMDRRRLQLPEVRADLAEPELSAWANRAVDHLANQIRDRMKLRMATLPQQERTFRFAALSERHWAQGDRVKAAAAFGAMLRTLPESVRADAEQGAFPPELSGREALEWVRRFWQRRDYPERE